jgi:translation initiation factor 2 subunit 1
MELEVGDVVLCTVERIEGTTVFVNIDETNQEGCIILSEIAPGRIRNLRDYVVPKKVIACKVLKISGNTIELSLRRVTQKEQKEAKEKYNQEKSYKSILKTVLGEKAESIIKEIAKKGNIINFFAKMKEIPKELETLVGKENSRKILEILNLQKQKKTSLKKEIRFHTFESEGLEKIKKILEGIKNAEIKYISAGNYSIKVEAEDLKEADNKLKKIIEELNKKIKENLVVAD